MCNVLNEDTMTCDYGVSKVLNKDSSVQIMHSKQQQSVHRQQQQQNARKVGVMGSRRIFPPSFKLKVLHSYRNDMDCRGNQRATARKYGIHRRQIQKWLQCEESLKNCAENTGLNTRPASTSTTDSSASVSKSDSTTEATTPTGPAAAAIPAGPALNLNVARLHGDELATQQKSPPPASPQHLPTRCSTSPPPCLRTVPKNVLLKSVLPVGHSQYTTSSDPKHLHREAEDNMLSHEIPYVGAQLDRDRNYYGDESTVDVERTQSVRSGDRSETVEHEDIRRYYWPSTEHQYTVNDIDASAHPQRHHQHHHSPNHCVQNYRHIDLQNAILNGHLYGLIGAPLIKAEPASPDSAATSGPYEPVGSPGGQWASQSPTVPHQVTNNSSGSSLSVHFNSATSPSYLDELVYQNAHTQTLLVSSTPYPSSCLHQHERESEETTGYAKEEGEQKERMEYYETMIKEEVDLPEDEIYDERQEVNASPYIDVTGDPTDSLDPENVPVEIELDDLENSTSSPGNPVNSGRSSSTSVNSGIESLDSAPGNQTSSNLTRKQQLRRSFPLKFKLNVLNAFYTDTDVAGNQRATAKKFDIHRRQVQKWLLQETDLRDEITFRRDSRQRLPPVQEVIAESPIDLTITNYASSDHSRPSSGTGLEVEYEQSPSRIHYYSHHLEPITSRHRPYHRPLYHLNTEAEPSVEVEHAGPCILSCCTDRHTTTSTTSSCQDLSLRGSYGSTESPPSGLHCYSPKDYSEFFLPEEQSPSLKRQAYSWNDAPSPKRFCPDDTVSQNVYQTQDRPLCLVKPKKAWLMASRMEALARSALSESDASQPSSSASVRDDGILFKPYLDNPVCRPFVQVATNDAVQRDLSPNIRENIINNKKNIDHEMEKSDLIGLSCHATRRMIRERFNFCLNRYVDVEDEERRHPHISFLAKHKQREVMVSRMR